MKVDTPHGLRVLVVDNYDSFTYNLVQYIGSLGAEPIVHRNDKIDAEGAGQLSPDRIVISPGPGVPSAAGNTEEIIRGHHGKTPIFGICLGHQAIGEVFGGEVVRAPQLLHGKTSMVRHGDDPLFAKVDSPFEATRYHSLVVDRESCPDELEITAWTDDDLIMGLRVRGSWTVGVQFHPESVMTKAGMTLLENFLCCKN